MDIFSIIFNIITGLLGIIALIISFYVFKKSKREESYADLDYLYLELLKLGIAHPKFVNLKYTSNYKKTLKDEDELHQYETYAFISWNICETIYDRQHDDLFETWRPVIVAENRLHRNWFDNRENFHKFRDEFRIFIKDNF